LQNNGTVYKILVVK